MRTLTFLESYLITSVYKTNSFTINGTYYDRIDSVHCKDAINTIINEKYISSYFVPCKTSNYNMIKWVDSTTKHYQLTFKGLWYYFAFLKDRTDLY